MCIPNKIHYCCGHEMTAYSANSSECNYKIHTEAVDETTHRWPDNICPECSERPFSVIGEKPEIVEWLQGVVKHEVYKRQREDQQESGVERRGRGTMTTTTTTTSNTVATAAAAAMPRQARRNRSPSKERKKKYERGNVFERAGG
ncbi:uncharacterized protein LAJ45_00382 [Morchella importuna]|uniref:uncharacterized protein n=1 Tax=Morchella importuna TaxID=1174673 RepID=UPI001E8E59EA|nr:uncharacterized protein LAJ45_00382 [Morchella importuna]KAH8155372.1 hypothetical protein LAJ45_00382 [Morchella importuna]